MNPEELILRGRRPEFGKDEFHEKRRGVNLLEVRLELRTQSVTHEPPQAHVLGRARECFEVRGINRGLTDFLDVGRMAEARECVAVE